MTKTVTNTGLVRVECKGQVWFDRPGYTEVIFKRLHIVSQHEFKEKGSDESISNTRRDVLRSK